MTDDPSGPELAAELEHLRAQLAEAREVLRAVRSGEVDGVLVTGDRGEQVYTLSGADRIYRQLIETMSEGAVTVSADGVILYCNVRLAEMLGQPLDRVMGTALRNYLPPADQQALDAILAQARTEPSRREINLKSSEGRLVPVYLSASRLPGEGAEVVFCLVLTDLTEQRSHEQIVAAERLARSILEQAAEAIVVCDEQGRVIRASQAAQRFCDGSPLLRPFAEVFPLRTDASGPFHLTPALQGETLRNVDVALDRQGQRFALILNAGPLLSGKEILGCVVTLTDVTERRQATEGEARLAAILEATPDLVGIADPEGRFVYLNRAGRKMLGIDELTDLTRYNIREFHDAASTHVVLTEGIPTAMREGAWTGETQLVALDGHAIATSQVILAHKAANGTVAFVSTIARDITERKRAEEAREHREAELQESQRLARIGSWEWTPATGVVTWSDGMNHVLARDCGLPPPTFEALPQFYTPESWQRLGAVIARALETGAPYDLDLEMIRADGATCWTTTRGEAMRGADGTVVKLRGTVHDITERKRAEEALRESEARYRRFIEMAQEGFGETDLAGRLVSVNVRLNQMFGYTLGEMIGLNIVEDLVFPEDRAEMVERLQARSRGKAVTYEQRFRKKTGEPMWLHVSGAPITNANGVVLGAFAMMTDITERKRVEGTLRLQSAALNAAATAMIITDANGTIEWVNAAFTRLTGYSVEEAIDRNPRELVKSGVHNQAFYKRLWDTILAGDVWRGEMTNRRKDGSLYSEEQTITPVRNDRGEVAHFIAIKRDLTEQHQLEAQFLQAQKMETVGRLAGGIAHDFNNLLTVINGTAELAAMDLRADDPLRTDFEEIRRAGDRAAALTRQLLAFSRKQIMKFEVLNLSTVVVNLQSMLQRLIGEHIALVVAPVQEVGSVMADPVQIEQVVMNLAVNARDAMPNGGTLTIETRNVTLDEAYAAAHPSVQPGPHVMLAISDTGVGMDKATRARIFEPFFTTKDPGKGTGLGLSTAYGIVKQSGGSIWVYSEPGKGTAFKIYLPRIEAAAPHGHLAPTVTSGHGTETILIVEDEEAVKQLARRVLQSAGYTVLTASHGVEALAVLERHDGPVHLVLTDMVMPGMSGRDLVVRIEAISPRMKVLYTSGYTDEAISRDTLFDKATHFIGKPYAAAELRRKVRDVLDSSDGS